MTNPMTPTEQDKELREKRIEKHMNNAGRTPKNIRITQVGIELAPTWGFFGI